jgi:hypothetical protein
LLPLLLILFTLQAPATCADPSDCRRQSSEAAARGEFELAHDLAWRAMQKSKPNDPASMLVLARAQSLSGRPGDALVMLERLAALGVRPDIQSDPDFARVRALPDWAAVAARLAPSDAASAGATAADPRPAAASAPTASSASPSAAPATKAGEPAGRESAPPDAGALSFSAPGVEPFALAHDAVSRRFVLGDRKAHRLLIVDEVSRNVVNFVSAASAGFYEQLTAFTIDARRGDLWVASARGSGDAAESIVHKLQLVSGRALMEARAPEQSGPIRFVAVAATPDGTVFAVDGLGARLFRLRPGARTFETVMKLDVGGDVALAAMDDRVLYVGSARGLARIDPAARSATPVKSKEDLGGFVSLFSYAGTLVGVERVAGSFLVVRVRLDPAGARVQARQVLATSTGTTAGALAADSFYYLSDAGTIRRLPLR